MIQCYNNDELSFDHLLTLPIKKQKSLAESVQSDVDIILEEFEKIEDYPNWWQRKVNKAKSKDDEQDVLDGLLKTALPIIWHQNEMFKLQNYKDLNMVKYLPDGKEDAAEILLEGKWPIRVWKYGILYFEFQNKNAIDEGIRNTKFHCIASHQYCKHFTNILFFSVERQRNQSNESCF